MYSLFRYLNRKKLIVLTYHGITTVSETKSHDFEYRNCVHVHQFEKQVDFLLKYYEPLKGFDWIADNPNRLFQSNTFLITFDDGFFNNYSLAFPLLKKKSVPGVFFITTGMISKKELLWTEKIIYLLMHTNCSSITLILDKSINLPLSTMEEKENACQIIRSYLKQSTKFVINQVINQLESVIDDVNLSFVPNERYYPMTWEQIKEMSQNGMLIGSHTHNHMLLSSLSLAEVEQELSLSKKKIEQETGTRTSLFSYPNGRRDDFNNEHKKILKKLDYKYAFSQISGFNNIHSDLLEIRRINITNLMDITSFEAYVSGFMPFIKKTISIFRK